VISASVGATDRKDLGGGHLPQFGVDSTGSVVAMGIWLTEPPGPSHVRVVDWTTGAQLADIPGGAGNTAVRPGAEEVLLPVGTDRMQRFGFTGRPIGPPAKALPDAAGIDYAPNGRVFMWTTDRQLELYDADTLQPIGGRVTTTGSNWIGDEWRPDSTMLAVGSDDGSIVLVDATTGEVVDRLTGAARGPGPTWLDDNRLLGASRGGASVFDLTQRTALGRAATADHPFGRLVPLTHGGALAGQGSDVVVVDAHGVRTPPVAHLHVQVGSLTLSADERRIAVLGAPADGGSAHAVVVDRTSGQVVWDRPVAGSETSAEGRVAFSPDGRRLAVGTYDGSVAVLDAGTGRTLVRTRTDKLRIGSLLWSRDGAVLYEGGHDGVLRRLRPDTLEPTGKGTTLTSERTLTDMVPVPGTTQVAVAAEDGTIHFVDVRAGRTVGAPLSSEGSELQSLALSPDGRWVTAMSRDGALRLWDRASGRAVGPPLQAHDADSAGLAWLADGTLLTASTNGSLVDWTIAPSLWARRACRLVGHDLGRDLWNRYLPGQPYRRTCAGL
jgi:WD40 repeat protein